MVNGEISWPGWETVRLIGRGSFGAVYEIQRDVVGEIEKAALKVISIPQSPNDIEEMYSDGYDDESITATFNEHLKSIVAEYSLMRKLGDCVNVVRCDDVRYVQHDSGVGWDIFIKMELLTPLTKVLHHSVPEETVIKLGKDICSALVACKKNNVIHRDIKPQNIFISDNGDYKLGDFGIAKTIERTAGGTKIGTYKYMAPEVYNNQPYGSAADIYSLGLVMYQMLNDRRLPFLPGASQTVTASMEENARHRRFSGEPIPAPAYGSGALKAVVLKACAFDPADRYRTPGEMLQDLEALSGGNAPQEDTDIDLDIRASVRITAAEAAEGCVKPLVLDGPGRVNVKIPKGIQNGAVIRLVGLGREHPSTSLVGDAYITVGVIADVKPCSDSDTEPIGYDSRAARECSAVVSSKEARSGCSKTVTFKNGTSKKIRIPPNCRDGQVVDGVTVYVHDIRANPGDMHRLPDAVLEIYANRPTHLGRNILFTFLGWMLFGMTTMAIPVMAIGLMITVICVTVSAIRKSMVIKSAQHEQAARRAQSSKA